jgi:hypothetical protein
MLKVKNAVAAAFENFEFVVQSLNEARNLQIHKVIGNFIPIPMEGIEAGQTSDLI